MEGQGEEEYVPEFVQVAFQVLLEEIGSRFQRQEEENDGLKEEVLRLQRDVLDYLQRLINAQRKINLLSTQKKNLKRKIARMENKENL